jgi:autonomous glycyl radical cofactor GrcA
MSITKADALKEIHLLKRQLNEARAALYKTEAQHDDAINRIAALEYRITQLTHRPEQP